MHLWYQAKKVLSVHTKSTVPEVLTVDAGYGSHANYDYHEQENIQAYVKYNSFNQEQKLAKNKRKKKNRFKPQDLHYNTDQDYYICPMGQKMKKTGEKKRTTEAGYTQQISIYQVQNCQGCPIRPSCHKSKHNRTIERNHELERHKQKARDLLISKEGIRKRKQRTADVEPIFAYLKHNRGCKRFTLRTLKKAELEFGLQALAHNLSKLTG